MSILFPTFNYDPSLPKSVQIESLEKVLKKKFKELVYNEKIDEAMDYLKAIVLDLNLPLRYLDVGLFYISCLCMKVLDMNNAYLITTQICSIKYRSQLAISLCNYHKTHKIDNFIKCAKLLPSANEYLGKMALMPEITDEQRFKLIQAIKDPFVKRYYSNKIYFNEMNKVDLFEQSIKIALQMPDQEIYLKEWLEEAIGLLSYKEAVELLYTSISHIPNRDDLLKYLCVQYVNRDKEIAYLLFDKIQTVQIAKELDHYFM
jgi:hypothetical protein